MLTIISHWLTIANLYITLCDSQSHFRRWWVKPHIREEMRNIFGVYETLFFYFAENDHEEFYKMTRMMPNQFLKLYNLVRHRLIKTSPRRPLSKKLRLFITLN